LIDLFTQTCLKKTAFHETRLGLDLGLLVVGCGVSVIFFVFLISGYVL